jgi:hypothetical protein
MKETCRLGQKQSVCERANIAYRRDWRVPQQGIVIESDVTPLKQNFASCSTYGWPLSARYLTRLFCTLICRGREAERQIGGAGVVKREKRSCIIRSTPSPLHRCQGQRHLETNLGLQLCISGRPAS